MSCILWVAVLTSSLVIATDKNSKQRYFPGMEPSSTCLPWYRRLAVQATAAGAAAAVAAMALRSGKNADSLPSAQPEELLEEQGQEDPQMQQELEREKLERQEKRKEQEAVVRGQKLVHQPIDSFADLESFRHALPDMLAYMGYSRPERLGLPSEYFMEGRLYPSEILTLFTEMQARPGFDEKLKEAGFHLGKRQVERHKVFTQLETPAGRMKAYKLLSDVFLERTRFGASTSSQNSVPDLLAELHTENAQRRREEAAAKTVDTWAKDDRVSDATGTERKPSLITFIPAFALENIDDLGFVLRRRMERQGGVERLRLKLKEWVGSDPVVKDFVEVAKMPLEDAAGFVKFLGDPDLSNHRRYNPAPSKDDLVDKQVKKMDQLLREIILRHGKNLNAYALWIEAQVNE